MSNGFTGHEVATTVTDNAVTYHQTVVASRGPVPMDDRGGRLVTLNTGGWSTVTTKRRMNQAAEHWGYGFRVSQNDFEWAVYFYADDDDRAPVSFTGDVVTFPAYPVHWDGERWASA